MARRKNWESLSDTYRKRLQRSGIGKTEYESGRSLARARGHTSEQAENRRRRQYRFIERWVRRYIENYGRIADVDEDEIRDIIQQRIDEEGLDTTVAELKEQEDLENLYDAGLIEQAQTGWKSREQVWPDWMYYYHGVFNG